MHFYLYQNQTMAYQLSPHLKWCKCDQGQCCAPQWRGFRGIYGQHGEQRTRAPAQVFNVESNVAYDRNYGHKRVLPIFGVPKELDLNNWECPFLWSGQYWGKATRYEEGARARRARKQD